MNFNVSAHTEVEPRPNGKARICVRVIACSDDAKTTVQVADVDILMHAPVIDEPGKFVVEEVAKVLKSIGALGTIQRVDPAAIRHLGLVKP